MKVIKNANAERLVKCFVPKEIRDLNPVIAGGFIVALWQRFIKHADVPEFNRRMGLRISKLLDPDPFDTVEVVEPYKPKTIFEKIENLFILDDTPVKPTVKRHSVRAHQVNKEFSLKFGDIDLWFLKDNPIWQERHEANFLLKNFPADEDRTTDENSSETFYRVSKALKEDFQKYKMDYGLTSCSTWANSYNSNFGLIPYQFIKKPFESIESLFDNFDILNCCAAYYDGHFYFSDKFEDSFFQQLLVPAKRFPRNTIISRIWVAKRAFKYAKRFGLEFTSEVCEELIQTFLDAEALQKRFEEEKNINFLEEESEAVVDIDNAYGAGVGNFSKRNTDKMIKQLLEEFPSFVSMKNFNEDHIFLFMSSKNDVILETIKKYLEAQERAKEAETKNVPYSEAKEVYWDEQYDEIYF